MKEGGFGFGHIRMLQRRLYKEGNKPSIYKKTAVGENIIENFSHKNITEYIFEYSFFNE